MPLKTPDALCSCVSYIPQQIEQMCLKGIQYTFTLWVRANQPNSYRTLLMCNRKKNNTCEKPLMLKSRPPSWRRSLKLSLVLPLWVSVAVVAQASFQPIERAMTDEERNRSGLSSLTAEQRQFLNDWLKARYGDDILEAPLDASNRAVTQIQTRQQSTKEKTLEAEVERRVAEELSSRKPPTATTNGPFEATLVGDFGGWRGKTVFRLDNGQIWRQRSASTYRHRGSDQRVKFDKNWMGGWEMTVVSSGKSVLVSKVK